MKTQEQADVIVIGAGMAGASVAAELAGAPALRKVLLVEQESQPGYHTTGRSAAIYTCAYGPPVIRALTRASYGLFSGKGQDVPVGLLRQRGVLFVAREDQAGSLAALHDELGNTVSRVEGTAVREIVPLLRPGYASAGIYDDEGADIEVHALHQYYLKRLTAAGGRLITGAAASGLEKRSDGWLVETPKLRLSAPVVINAAGAWADEIAALAGIAPLGLRPLRRTALLLDVPAGIAPEGWPMTVDVDEQFYLKPDAGKLLASPADETLSPPCDAQPEELDVAICIDRIETAFDLQVRRIGHKWAGLRSFLPDGCPAAGFDPDAEGFFWLAGQGGYGIQSAPALARAAAALVTGAPLPGDIEAEGVSAAALSPARLRVVA